jgi:hypothetical protein
VSILKSNLNAAKRPLLSMSKQSSRNLSLFHNPSFTPHIALSGLRPMCCSTSYENLISWFKLHEFLTLWQIVWAYWRSLRLKICHSIFINRGFFWLTWPPSSKVTMKDRTMELCGISCLEIWQMVAKSATRSTITKRRGVLQPALTVITCIIQRAYVPSVPVAENIL